jgi:hypothetical protein
VGNSLGKYPLERSRSTWEYKIKMDVREIDYEHGK